MHVLRADPDPALRVVDLQLAQAQDPAARGDGRERGPLDPAQQHVHPGGQLAHRERLGHVVVRADAEADQHVGLVVAGGQHEDRDGTLGLDPAAHLQAVETGQHHVQDHQVGLPGLGGVDGRRTVRRGLDEEALGAQPRGDRLHDRGVVLDHQDAPLGPRSGRRTVVSGVCLLHCPASRRRCRLSSLEVPAASRLSRSYLGRAARWTTSGTPRATGISSVRTPLNPAFRKDPSKSADGRADHTARIPPGFRRAAQDANPSAE